MNIYQFIENNPWVTVIMAIIIGITVYECTAAICKAFKRKGGK